MTLPLAEQPFPVQPAQVRYIKLGERGGWEKECLEKGIIRIGFGTARPERYLLVKRQDWAGINQAFVRDGVTKGTATRFTNELRLFAQDDGSTLWLTFVGERLGWGTLTQDPIEKHPDGSGGWRRVAGGWRCTDRNGIPLTKDNLSGALAKLAAYRGTSCGVGKKVADYAIGRINGEQIPQVQKALAARTQMRAAILQLLQLLDPKDFELLVDLIFSASGWRRQGIIGKAQKTLDIDLLEPLTKERAFVQVKSDTNQAQLAEYVRRKDDLPHSRMFYVYHSGEAESEYERVTVLGPERLAELVLDMGLLNWLIDKVS